MSYDVMQFLASMIGGGVLVALLKLVPERKKLSAEAKHLEVQDIGLLLAELRAVRGELNAAFKREDALRDEVRLLRIEIADLRRHGQLPLLA